MAIVVTQAKHLDAANKPPVVEPGAPNKTNLGHAWPATPHDDLQSLSGRVGDLDDQALRRDFFQLGIAGAHSESRATLINKFAAITDKIFSEAGQKAVADWLAKQRG